jgi:hypothetical protein
VDWQVAIVRRVHLQVIGVMQSLMGPYVGGATALEDAGHVQVVCELPMALIPNFSNMRRCFLALILGGSPAADSLQHRFGDPFPGMPVCSVALAPFLCGILRCHCASLQQWVVDVEWSTPAPAPPGGGAVGQRRPGDV